MYGTAIGLKHKVSEQRFRDFLSEAEHQRKIAFALEARPAAQPARIAEARTAVARVLLRAGSWIMPEEAPDGGLHPAPFELRPGQ